MTDPVAPRPEDSDIEAIRARLQAFRKGGWTSTDAADPSWEGFVPVAKELYSHAADDIDILFAALDQVRQQLAESAAAQRLIQAAATDLAQQLGAAEAKLAEAEAERTDLHGQVVIGEENERHLRKQHAAVIAAIKGLEQRMRSDRPRFKLDVRGGVKVVTETVVDEWADELQTLLAQETPESGR